MTVKKNKDSHDVDLVYNQFLAGDNNAFSSLYKIHIKELYALGTILCRDHNLIEDAIHDVFVAIYTREKHLAKIENIRYYLIISFRNRLFYLLKQRSILSELMENEIYRLEEKNFQDLWIENEIDNEKQLKVNRLLNDLNLNQREAVYYRFVEGLSYDEIAALMDIKYQSAKNLIHRAIKKLKLANIAVALSLIISLFK